MSNVFWPIFWGIVGSLGYTAMVVVGVYYYSFTRGEMFW
jgi:hypothetical protein